MSPAKGGAHKEAPEMPRPTTKIQITDMDTVQEEAGNDSDDSTHSDVEKLRERTRAMLTVGGASAPLMPSPSQPSSRRMSSDIDPKNLNTRRPSAIIAAFRRPSQALALCAATQRRFLSEMLPRSSTASTTSAQPDATLTRADIIGQRPSAIIAAPSFRRPSQALALCAATQRRFLGEMLPRSSTASTTSAQPDATLTRADIIGHEALSKALSALYAKLLVVLGLAFPVTEAITENNRLYQGYYCYLYGMSVLFVAFQYATLVKQKAVSSIIHEYAEHEKSQEKAPLKMDKKENISRYGSFYLRLGAIVFGIGSMVYSGLDFGCYYDWTADCGSALAPHICAAATFHAVGLVLQAFGIGSMVYSGLEFGGYFDQTADCGSALAAVTPALRVLLTLLQMQFIFLNNKEIESSKHKMVQRFGLMHMIATNLCEWLYVVVAETSHEIHHLDLGKHTNGTAHGALDCGRDSMMGDLLQKVSPFLFPCTIEYSLICAVIFYEMWKEVKCTPDDFEKKLNPAHHNKSASSRQNSVTPEKILQQFAGMLGVGSPGGRAAQHHFSLDCSHAHRGLFAGILLVVATIISLIMFFVLTSDMDNHKRLNDGIFEVNIWELILYVLTMMAVIVAHIQMRALHYKRKSGAILGMDTSLLMLAQSGMFIYCMFSMIGCIHTLDKAQSTGLTGFFLELLSLLQTIVQTLFIIDAWWRRCNTREQRTTKPGRQLVTFLLVANMAMWAVNTLEKNRAEFRPDHLEFYGHLAWTVITHVSMPLAIFYRFHSTICLFEIWKNSFKNKPIYIDI